MEENKNKIDKKKILLALGIVSIVIVATVGICSYLLLREYEEFTNTQDIKENEEEQNIENTELPASEGTTSNGTNELVQNEINKTETTNEETKNNVENQEKIETVNKETNQTTQEESIKKEPEKEITNQPTAKEENSSTTNDSNKTTTDPVEDTKPTLTGTEEERKLTNTETKYGVKIDTYTTTIYNVYSDGSKTVQHTSSITEYDRTNYKATTSELLSEAKSAKSKYLGMISQIINNVNTYREEANTANKNEVSNRVALALDEKLCIAANVRAVEMAYSKKYSHTRPDGTSCFTVVDEMGIGYMTVGENIASGQTSADSVSRAWKNSPGHYENMISEDFSKIGVGVYKLDGAYYWVQLFTN